MMSLIAKINPEFGEFIVNKFGHLNALQISLTKKSERKKQHDAYGKKSERFQVPERKIRPRA